MPRFHIEIDRELCIGDQLCCTEAPHTFAMDDDNKAVVTNPEGDEEEVIVAAAKSCPVDCISIRECQSGKQVWPEE
jgi:ferredoxin